MIKYILTDILSKFFPDNHFISVFSDESGFFCLKDCFKSILKIRTAKDYRPIFLYGFDCKNRILKKDYGKILDAPGVFYLKLPISILDIKALIEKANACEYDWEKDFDFSLFQSSAIREIRNFKHAYDNLWMAMSAKANSLKKNHSPSCEIPVCTITLFNPERIAGLIKEYENIEYLMNKMDIENTERIPRQLNLSLDELTEARNLINDFEKSFNLVFSSIEKLKRVSEILNNIKTFEKNE